MLKIQSQLGRALAYEAQFGNASDADRVRDNDVSKPNLPGTRAQRIHAAQYPVQKTVSKIPPKNNG
ncbi:MAG: hypothetical protein WAW59_03045 [Patescibacteria group bacterium]